MKNRNAPMRHRTRRQFLYNAASLAFIPATRARGTSGSGDDCAVSFNPLLRKPFLMNSSRTIDAPGPATPRPLWSELGPSDRKDYLKLLNTAYKSYLERTTQSGCLNQMQVHHLFCGGRVQKAMDSAKDTSGFDIHQNYFFLPWHRAFLYFHERVLQSFLPKNTAFRLPVYDWENVRGQDLPAAYRALPRPDFHCSESKSSPAFSPCYMQGWLVSDNVERFIGGPGPNRPPESARGPHNDVHVQLKGLMMDMSTSAADPVFWAHHANIDRYWAYWVSQYKSQQWVKDNYKWPEGHFYFYDRDDSLVRVSIKQMLEPEQLGYTYTPPTIPITSLAPSYLNLTTITINQLSALLLPALISVSNTTSLVRYSLNSRLRALDPKTQGNIQYYSANATQMSQEKLNILIECFVSSYKMAPKADLSLPTVMSGTSSERPAPGYYIVDITDGLHRGRIGGFSVLEMQPAPYVSMACMSADALKLIVDNYQTPGRLRFVYGPVDFTGEGIQGPPKPFNVIQTYVNLPIGRV